MNFVLNRNVRNLTLFSIVAISSGWLGVLINQFVEQPSDGETLGMGLWVVLPLLTVIFLRVFLRGGWKDLKISPRFKENLKWYTLALLIYPVVTGAVLLAGKILGWIEFSNFRKELYLAGFLSALLPGFIKNIFEESVWRGYLTTGLVNEKLKDVWIYLIVGGVWGIWHMPYYLRFLPEADLYQVLPVSRLTFAIVAVVSMTCWTVMFVELFRLTNSLWSVVILHTVEDAVINHLIIDKHITIVAGKEFLISPIAGAITSLLYLGVGVWLRRERIRKERDVVLLHPRCGFCKGY
jgi:hypothetical protein